MADRPVTLNLRTPQENGAGQVPMRQTHHGLADRQAAQDFARAMQQPAEAAAPAAAQDAPLPSPFHLLRPRDPQANHPPASGTDACDPSAHLMPALSALVDRLMVGDGQDGRRMARIELDESVLPGVVVVVQEDAGAWVAEFTCRHEGSFTRLAQPAQRMAFEMAQALSQDAVWKVVPDGLDPHGAWVRGVHFNGPDFTVEAYASAPLGARRGIPGRGRP